MTAPRMTDSIGQPWVARSQLRMSFEIIEFAPGLKPDIVVYFTQLEMFSHIFKTKNPNTRFGWAASRTYALEDSKLYRANIALSDKFENKDFQANIHETMHFLTFFCVRFDQISARIEAVITHQVAKTAGTKASCGPK